MSGKFIQFFAAFVISMGNFFVSYTVAWTSSALTVLTTDESPIGRVTEDQANLIGSLPMLGSFISTWLASWLTDNIGRKRTVILGGLCFILSWSLITTSQNVTCLLIGRFIVGIASIIHMVSAMPFISEISEISIRGTLMSFIMVLYSCGMLVAYLFGWFFSYQVINYINLTLCTAFVVLVSLLKDTPAYLVEKGMEKEAIRSLQFYRGMSTSIEEVLTDLSYLKKQTDSNKLPNAEEVEKSLEPEKEKLRLEDTIKEAENISALKVLWRSKPYKRALVVVIANTVLLVFGGTVAIAAYATQLFQQASPTLSSPLCSVMLAISFVVGGFFSMLISDLVGRRVLMMTSGAICSFCLATLASLLRWTWGPAWAVPAAVLAYCTFFQLGLGNIPWVQMSEIFPPKLKSLTILIVFTVMGAANFLVLALFAPAVGALGLDGAFLAFAAVCAVFTAHAYFFMKETRGAPLEEIERMYEEGYLYGRKSSF